MEIKIEIPIFKILAILGAGVLGYLVGLFIYS
jgi:ABC-type cobalt transport system substrate-binding protein